MAEPSTNKVTVRVEVVVEGAGGAPEVTVRELKKGRRKRFFEAILSPQPFPSRTPVTQSGGVNFIAANGNSPVANGELPQQVCVLAFPDPNEDPLDYPFPPPGAVCGAPRSDGSWSFSRVPGAACDNSSYPRNNSTLIVWFGYGSPPDWAIAQGTPFYGVCPASGLSGATSGVHGPAPLADRLRATALHATFTGALAPLGTVALRWNGAAWVGVSTHCGGAALSFLGLETACHLVSAGPGTAFVVAGAPGSFHPFHWSAHGTAVGAVSGPFHVTLTE